MIVIKREVEIDEMAIIKVQMSPELLRRIYQCLGNEKELERLAEEIYRNSCPKDDTEAPDTCNSYCEQESGKYDVENIFTYHSPQPGQPERYTVLRAGAKELARMVLEACPDSRERDQALKKIEEAVFWANASVARNRNEDG